MIGRAQRPEITPFPDHQFGIDARPNPSRAIFE
jgi:hypothetical protein